MSDELTAERIDKIKSSVRLQRLVKDRVHDLKRAGNGYRGTCPFHDDERASLRLNIVRQYYHCFDCGAHGDAFRWVMDTTGLAFCGAVREVERRVRIRELRERLSPRGKDLRRVRAALLELAGNQPGYMTSEAKLFCSGMSLRGVAEASGRTTYTARNLIVRPLSMAAADLLFGLLEPW